MINEQEHTRTRFTGDWIHGGLHWSTVLTSLAVVFMVFTDLAPAQSQALPGALSGAFDLNATSGQATITGDSELTGDVTLDMRFYVDYLVVAGGGGGGVSRGGGGGAGGLLTNVGGDGYSITPQSYTVIVGAGGVGQLGGTLAGGGANGIDSAFAAITAIGGGGGGGQHSTAGGKVGGSGGGARPTSTDSPPGGAGTAGQGHNGGNAVAGGGGGGGGGAESAGANGGSLNAAGTGGDGVSSAISGTAMPYAAGGGGGGSGGAAGAVTIEGATHLIGGAGSPSGQDGGHATPSTGSGGGGAYSGANHGGNGAAGIVIVRYAGDSAATGGTQSTVNVAGVDYQVHAFTTDNQLQTLTTALDFSGLDLNDRLGATLSGNLSGLGGINYAGPGKLTLTGTNTYTGATTIRAGTLALGGTGLIASPVIDVAHGATFDVLTVTGGFTLDSVQTLKGPGRVVGPMVIEGTISPGQGVGTLFTDDQAWTGGGKYTWEINSAADTAPGWDLISMAELAMTATEINPFTIEVHSLTLGNEAGVVSDFISTRGYSWRIASTSGITGWDVADGLASGLFTVDFGSFANSLPDGAGWSVSKMGNDVFLNYIPEPSAVVLLAWAAVVVLGMSRRQVK
ncbi:MAG: autotransporter-associated beta strand repeat-containing protein [Patescibacteria group bacterium]|nr:autotransporter-associated beta strand repeat-containing protein [Patescibacteria group bacterium]